MSDYEPKECKHEKIWETRAMATNTTSATAVTVYRTFSCELFFCEFPDRKCRVKEQGK